MNVIGPKYRLESEPRCPSCAKVLNGAAGVGVDATPGEGDWTICIYCHSLLIFGRGHTLRRATDHDVDALTQDEAREVAHAMMMLDGHEQ